MNPINNDIKKMTTLGSFSGVGVGPGDLELITLKAVRVLQNSDVIFHAVSRQSSRSVSGNVVDSLDDITAERVELIFTMRNDSRFKQIHDNAKIILNYLLQGKNCTFATIGDPLTYSTYGYIIDELKNMVATLEEKLSITTVPGVNSWSAVAAAENKVLVKDKERLCIIPDYEGTDGFDKELLENIDTAVILKTFKSRNAIIEQLQNYSSELDLTYAANIGLENQFVGTDLNEVLKRNFEYLSLLISRKNHEKEKN